MWYIKAEKHFLDLGQGPSLWLCLVLRVIIIDIGQWVGVTEVADDIWLVSFMDYDLGFFDNEVDRVESVGENPFTPKVLPMSPE